MAQGARQLPSPHHSSLVLIRMRACLPRRGGRSLSPTAWVGLEGARGEALATVDGHEFLLVHFFLGIFIVTSVVPQIAKRPHHWVMWSLGRICRKPSAPYQQQLDKSLASRSPKS